LFFKPNLKDNNLIETKNQIKTLKSSISAFEDREKQKARLSSDLESMEADLTAQAKVLEIKNNVIEVSELSIYICLYTSIFFHIFFIRCII
jgi:uncharacterized protein YhaN